MPRLRVQLAVSADGFIAPPDRSYEWLAPFPAGEFGIGEFMRQIGAIVMGRTCYDESIQMGAPDWGPSLPTLVVTSRPLSDARPHFTAVPVAGLADAIARLEIGDKDIWLFGGAATIAACLDQGLVDTLELAVVPRLLGDGLPLFARRTPTLDRLELRAAKPMTKDVLFVEYAVVRDQRSR